MSYVVKKIKIGTHGKLLAKGLASDTHSINAIIERKGLFV